MEQKMIIELMKNDCGHGTMSKDTNKALEHNLIVSKYNTKFNTTLKKKKLNKFMDELE